MIWLVYVLFAVGIVFSIMGTVGVLRFPDVFTRLHASAKCGTTAVFSILLGCVFYVGFNAMAGKIIAISLFFLITSPVSAHIVGRCAWQREILPWRRPGDNRSDSED